MMNNMMSLRLMKWSLMGLAIYFVLIALAHITGTKAPLLFVYYNVPSHAYQDNIISFLAFGWAAFVFSAARNPLANLPLIRAILIAAIGALAVLSYTNFTTNFAQFSSQIVIWPFWAQTGILAAITIWIFVLYRAIRD